MVTAARGVRYGEDGWKAAAEAAGAGEAVGLSPSLGSAETPARYARCGGSAAGLFLSAYDMMLTFGGERAGAAGRGLMAVIGVGDLEPSPPTPKLLTLAGLAGRGTGRMRGVPRLLGDPDRLLWFSSPPPRPLMMESMLKLLRGAARGGEAAATAAAAEAAAARWWWKGELDVGLSGLERLPRERWL